MSLLVCLGLSVCVGPGARTLVSAASDVHRVPLSDVATASSRASAGLMLWSDDVLPQEASSDLVLYDRAPGIPNSLLGTRGGTVKGQYITQKSTDRASMGVGGNVAMSHCVFASFVDLLTFELPLLSAVPFFLSAWMFGDLSRSLGVRAHLSKTPCPVLVLSLLVGALDGVHGVCPHCKDSIVGCSGGNDCPLFKEHTANTAMFDTRVLGSAPRITYSFPPELSSAFPRVVCEAVMGLACAPAPGAEIDLENDAKYATCRAVVQAAAFRHCSVPEASNVLTARLEDATEEVDILKIRGSIDALKLVQESVVEMTQGVYGFLWAKVSNVIMKRGNAVHRLSVGVKARASELTVSLMRPSTEFEFCDMLHYYTMVLVGLGLASYWVVSRFLDDVVWSARRTSSESWQAVHELLVLYVYEIDRDPSSSVTMGTVFRRGGQDTMLAEARRNVVMFFRTRGEKPQPLDGGVCLPCEPTGKFNTDTQKLCVDYNAGRPCKRLDAAGNCLFNHACNQFVSDKGPSGMCRGLHARTDCSYDTAKRLSKPFAK